MTPVKTGEFENPPWNLPLWNSGMNATAARGGSKSRSHQGMKKASPRFMVWFASSKKSERKITLPKIGSWDRITAQSMITSKPWSKLPTKKTTLFFGMGRQTCKVGLFPKLQRYRYFDSLNTHEFLRFPGNGNIQNKNTFEHTLEIYLSWFFKKSWCKLISSSLSWTLEILAKMQTSKAISL